MSKETVQNDHSKSFVSWRTTSSQDLDWTLVFVSFLSRYPSDTDNQIYLKSESRIWNSISLVLILCSASFQIYLSISPMCLSVLCSLSFDSTSENFEFRWSITDSILKALSVLLSFLLSAKCRFWRISQISLCSEYCHYRSDYLLSSIQQSWVTYWLPLRSLFQKMRSALPWQLCSFFPFWWA